MTVQSISSSDSQQKAQVYFPKFQFIHWRQSPCWFITGNIEQASVADIFYHVKYGCQFSFGAYINSLNCIRILQLSKKLFKHHLKSSHFLRILVKISASIQIYVKLTNLPPDHLSKCKPVSKKRSRRIRIHSICKKMES